MKAARLTRRGTAALRSLAILLAIGSALSAARLAAQAANSAKPPEDAKPAAVSATNFLYRSPQGLEFEVTAAGLSAIRVAGRTLASGGWSLFNAENWFKNSGSGAVKTEPVRTKSLERLGPRQARVVHVGDQVRTTTDYTFDGEDVTISARVENQSADQPLNVVGFSGLTFDFDRPPEGLMQVQHISYFQAHGLALCHPSYWSPIGGSYAVDSSIGVGLSPWKTGLARTLILWDYFSWEPNAREKLPKRRLIYFVGLPVPARGARTFDLRLRVSSDRDWRHLLAPYREHFLATFGTVGYDADYRWIATDYLNHSRQAISPTNPYGFQGGARRLDLREGVDAFCKTVISALKSAGGQGVILWGQGGEDPRGAMYRPDFDILPPEVERNWPVLAERFRDAHLKLGVATRPADLALRLDWQQDQIIPINADDPAHREMLWRRFQRMIDRGCTLFYLDSFGDDLEHVRLMRYLRQRIGRKILTFTEHQCDAMLPFSGGYSEATFDAAAPAGPEYRVWSGADRWRIYQWLVPGAQLAARLYQVQGRIPDSFEPVDEFFFRQHITPLLPVSDFRRVAGLRAIQDAHLDADGKWKTAADSKPSP
ncbi:MAG TPA: hypothetical protein VHX65_19700 [Pirellulales bacterium]|nr:hypothetical protein [Pirellulales bacterium]